MAYRVWALAFRRGHEDRNEPRHPDTWKPFVWHRHNPDFLVVHELNEVNTQEFAKTLNPFRETILQVDLGLLFVGILRVQCP